MQPVFGTIARPRPASAWTLALGVFSLALAVLAGLYWRTFASLVWVWAHDGTFQYAFLIFPLSAWTAYGLRRRLFAVPPKPSIWGLPVVAGLGFLWLLGSLVRVNVVEHFAVVALIPALVLALWGTRAVRVLAFPLGYLVFAIPAGDSLVGSLQDFTARFAVKALTITGVPVLLDGRELITATSTWMVGEACSGIKFFIASLALGCLFAYLMYRRWWKRATFVALSAVVPIIANGLRVYFTILIGERFGLKYATGTDHMIFGWQFFGTVLLLLLLIGWWWRDPVTPARKALPAPRPASVGGRSWVRIAAVALLVCGPTWSFVGTGSPSADALPALQVPRLPGWQGPKTTAADWRPHFVNADSHVQAVYRRAGADNPVEFYAALYEGAPRRGHDLLTYGNDLYDAAAANVLHANTRRIRLPSGRRLRVQEVQIGTPDGVRVIWSWYQIDGHPMVSPALAKVAEAMDVLRGKRPRASVWAVSAVAASGDLPKVHEDMTAFLGALEARPVEASRVQNAQGRQRGDVP